MWAADKANLRIKQTAQVAENHEGCPSHRSIRIKRKGTNMKPNARRRRSNQWPGWIVAAFVAVWALGAQAQSAQPASKEAEQPDIQEERIYVDKDAGSLHDQLFIESKFPSAHTCGQCHPQQFREWSVSPHAYATFSPVFLSLIHI